MIQDQGNGWRLKKDTSKKKYSFLIGGDDWAVELTDLEWNGLYQVVCKLVNQYEQMTDHLMKEEEIFIEVEISPWWACINGNREFWSLRCILNGEEAGCRSMELFWPIPSAQILVSSMKNFVSS